MSVIVRTLGQPEDDKKIGRADRPMLVDIVHAKGTYTDTVGGELMVYSAGDIEIAVYSAGNWFFARVETEEQS